jgi:hypothetical protein
MISELAVCAGCERKAAVAVVDDFGYFCAECEEPACLHEFLRGKRISYGEAGRALGVHPNSLRYAS